MLFSGFAQSQNLLTSRISSNWPNNQSNVDRTNAIIKKIANTYKDNTTVVPAIAPLNE
jgi:aryl-phospho-beta-D-glucosidase BglC (GH1 family)